MHPQVLASANAAAVLQQPSFPYDPATELLFRDFCEVLVRLAAMRYPQLPRLELQVQQSLAQHLLPLLGGHAGRQGGSRQPLQARASITRSDASPVPAGAAVGGSTAAGPGQEQSQEEVVLYLQSQALLLQQLFAALCSTVSRQHMSSDNQQQQQQPDTDQQPGTAADVPAGGRVDDQQAFADTAWLQQAVTVRQVAAALDQAGWLQHWQLSLAEVSGLLLEGVLQVADPEGPR